MRQKVIILAVGVTIVVAAMAWLLISPNRSQPVEPATPAPSPTAAVDSAAIETYSREFMTKYATYSSPRAAGYLDSIKPFLTEQEFAEIADSSRRVDQVRPQRADIETVEVAGEGTRAVATVTIQVTEEGASPYTQTYRLEWVYESDRWAISDLKLLTSTKQYPYLES